MPRRLPRSRRAPRHADRARRARRARRGGADLSTGGWRLGLGFQSDKAAADYGRLAAAAEGYGFDVVSVFADLWFQPPLPALLAMARATSRVELGPACLNPFTLHPVEIAGQIAALDAASDGRAYLGLARGSWLGPLGVDQADAPVAVVEAARLVGALLAGDDSGFEGRRFRLPPGARLASAPRRSAVPLLVGTWGPRLAALAAGLAAELKVGGSANPDLVPVARSWLAAGGGARTGIVLGAVTVVDDDRRAARARAREEAAMYLEVVAALDPTVELDPGLLERIGARLRAGDRSGAGALVADEVLDRFTFSGTPEDVAAHAAAVFEAGASRVEFGTPHGLSDDEGVRLLGSRVLPALRSAGFVGP